MLSIGDFARLGRISVRMLRHYDAIGLLVPARVDPVTGYRWYDAAQLPRLNRVLALKDLGFSLDQVRSMVDDEVGAEELRGMLRLRHAELVEQISADRQRLARVERRLRTIEREGTHVRAGVRRQGAGGSPGRRPDDRGGEYGEGRRGRRAELRGAGRAAGRPGRRPASRSTTCTRTASVAASSALPYDGGPGEGYDIVELPPVPRAATVLHHGSMDTIGDTWQELVRHVEASGHRATGLAREVYLAMPPGDPDAWVTELQEPLE